MTTTINSLVIQGETEIRDVLANQDSLGFVLLWSRDEPERVGEVALMPDPRLGTLAVLGRGDPPPEDAIPRMQWCRQQPGRNELTGPLRSPCISRIQLYVEVESADSLLITNIGRCVLLHEGREVESVSVSPGEMIELRNQVLMLCVRRQRDLVPADPPVPLHAFGEADAHGLVGESPAIWALRASIAFIAGRSAHVLIQGPSGTGKELVAQAIHRLSRRGHMPLVSRNAATFPETLIDAELFGSARGFPNPGMPERPGLVGEANGSTLFLDEFAELSQQLQAHLLRVLDSGEYTRLGESRSRHSDFRLVAATNRPEHALKEDVLARLRLRMEMYGLDQRREDIPLIARHLLHRLARDDEQIARRYFPGANPEAIPRMSKALVEHLVRHSYSTHVRELESMLWRAMCSGPGEVLDLWASGAQPIVAPPPELQTEPPPPSSPSPPPPLSPSPGRRSTTAPLSRPAVDPLNIPPEEIQACLDRHGGRQEPVWRELGFSSRHVLTRLIRRYGLTVRGRARG